MTQPSTIPVMSKIFKTQIAAGSKFVQWATDPEKLLPASDVSKKIVDWLTPILKKMKNNKDQMRCVIYFERLPAGQPVVSWNELFNKGAESVECPFCKIAPGNHCQDYDNTKQRWYVVEPHKQRIAAYEKQKGKSNA